MSVLAPPSYRAPDARHLRPDAERWVEAVGLPILGVDGVEAIRFANAIGVQMLGGGGRGLIGRRLEEVFGRDAPVVSVVRRAAASRRTVAESDIILAGPGFALGRADVTAAPLEEGGYVALTIAVRPPPRMPASPQPSAAAVRTLAHEVRNPLAGIRAAAQLIGRDGDPETAGLADLICQEVDRIRRLTERIDPQEAPGAASWDLVNIHAVVDRVRRVVASGAPDVTIRERFDPSLPPVRGDFDQLVQALLNVAKNGMEAVRSVAGPELTLSTSYRAGLRVRAAAGAPALPQLEVAVIDNGPGVAADIADRLFEPFATTKSGGMGLGLAVTADIIARHLGRIEVESAPGRTAFKILLPLDVEGGAQAPVAP